MNGLQYKHYQEHNRTYAVHPPALAKLEEAMVHYIVNAPFELVIALGSARVHPEDQYCKEVGRKTAFSKIKMVKMRVSGFYCGEETIEVCLKGGGYTIGLTVRKNREVPIVRDIHNKAHR